MSGNKRYGESYREKAVRYTRAYRAADTAAKRDEWLKGLHGDANFSIYTMDAILEDHAIMLRVLERTLAFLDAADPEKLKEALRPTGWDFVDVDAMENLIQSIKGEEEA